VRNILGKKILESSVFLLAIAVAAIAGCGGSGGGSLTSSGAANTSAVVASSQIITGTVATGAALANARVTVKDGTGATVVGTTDANGILMNSTGTTVGIPVGGMTLPFMLQASSSVLGAMDMYSVLSNLTTPNVNITPITTLIMYELYAGRDPGNTFQNFVSVSSVVAGISGASAVVNTEGIVRTRLANSLATTAKTALLAVSSGYSMVTGKLTADGVDLYDKALDQIGKITAYPSAGGASLLNISNVSASYTTATVASTPTAASFQFLPTNSYTLTANSASGVPLTLVVLDANNQTIVGKTVTFTIACASSCVVGTPDTSYVSASGTNGVSDTNGQVYPTVYPGTSTAARTITISAHADSAAGSHTITIQ